jgi:hypothetical protein
MHLLIAAYLALVPHMVPPWTNHESIIHRFHNAIAEARNDVSCGNRIEWSVKADGKMDEPS